MPRAKSRIKSKRIAKHHKKKGEGAREQSAMEYLMTYGWAILILAIVIIVLFQLKFFTYQQRALPGSCYVVRPGGPGTGTDASLEGLCYNYPPQTIDNIATPISNMNAGGGKGGGGASLPVYVYVPQSVNFGRSNSFTISMWLYYLGTTATHCEGILGNPPEPGTGFQLFGYGGNKGSCGPLWINGSYVKWPKSDKNNSFSANSWQFIVATYNYSTGNATVFDNGTIFANVVITPRTFLPVNSLTIGAVIWTNGDVYPINGYMSNVQLYNKSFSTTEVEALYKEGIGGDPLEVQYLIGWWPLNDNTNDYSGNNNYGIAENITYYGSYQTPSVT
ncbi:MAG: LamG domain-containing protein [Candidatus Marsarchaeota archaeon]|nr:LamG domain-containing protein [Candidatus Marsarchaeota archaeon]